MQLIQICDELMTHKHMLVGYAMKMDAKSIVDAAKRVLYCRSHLRWFSRPVKLQSNHTHPLILEAEIDFLDFVKLFLFYQKKNTHKHTKLEQAVRGAQEDKKTCLTQ